MQKQKILIIGGGGREHAIGWKVAQSQYAGELFFAPGNAGTAALGTNIAIAATDIAALMEFVKKENIDLTLALPDDPLALGIVNEFEKSGLRIWGPTKAAAHLESSKAFAKEFMQRHGLPTARFDTFTDFEQAKEYATGQKLPLVIKASGLALGKGVVIADTLEEAIDTLENMLVKKVFGESGSRVVIEEFLVGTEISTHAFSDGTNYKIFPPSQDHKRIGEGNTGLNTGGMGTVAPLPSLDAKVMQDVEEKIIAPTLRAMTADGMPFAGLLYPGLMITADGPKIIEFNARFGDPETQTYMRLLDTDILEIINISIDGKLSEIEIKWKPLYACTIILAAGGYPENYEKGKVISGIDKFSQPHPSPLLEGEGVVIFHAGTKFENNNLVTNGGRVLGISAAGTTLAEALGKAYGAIEKISFDGMYYRKDIGKQWLS